VPESRLPPPAWDEDRIERSGFLDQLARDGSRAGDDVVVIVGRDHSEPSFIRKPPTDFFAILAFAIVEDDLGAGVFRRRSFHLWRMGRHHDHPRDVEQLSRKRNRLRVIA
jgi:hypothetical protein